MGMVARKGIGRVRHIEVGELWIQDAVKRGVLSVQKVKGEYNPADILIKYVDKKEICTSTATLWDLRLRADDRSQHWRPQCK